MCAAPYTPGFEVGECLYRSPRTLVYRAMRLHDGAPVVLKCPNIEFPGPQEVARITLEAQILARFDSDAIVRTHGVVPSGGSLALVLEDFGATSVQQWLDRQVALIDIGVALQLAISVAKALAQVHARGLVHRDVKPDNILVDATFQRVVLADFSHYMCREEAPAGAMLAGTLAYISPEQTGQMNRAVDYRSDYYSLGVTLYALLTGTLPFTDSEPIELVHAHLARDPLPLDSPAPGRRVVPTPLSHVVLKLMSKSAEDRYQSAHGLVADLRRCRDEWQARGTIEPFPVGTRDVSEMFQIPTELFGRDDARQRILAALERSMSDRGELVLLHGPSGIGKSAVVRELAAAIVARRGWIAVGKCEQFERSVPYGPVLQVLRDAAEQLLTLPGDRLAAAGVALATELGANAQLAIECVPELGGLLGPQPPPSPVPPGETAHRFRGVLTAAFRGLAATVSPLVVYLDDLQWADPATLDLFPHLIAEGATGLLWIGAFRDEDVGPDHPLQGALLELEHANITPLRVALGPLTRDSIESIIRGAVAPALADPAALAAEVHTRTRGNPFFTRMLLGALYEQGLIVFDQRRGGWTWDLAEIRGARMPDDVGGFLAQQLAALPEEARAVLSVAACIGTRFHVDLLARVLESAESRPIVALQPALALGLVVREGACFAFAHDQILRGAAATLATGARPRVHLALGRLLQCELSSVSAGEALFTVASHFEIGRALLDDPGERAELSGLFLRAGEAALAASAPVAALAYLRGGFELLGPDPWARDPARARALTRARMTAALLCREFTEGATQFEALLARAGGRLDRLALFTARVHLEVTMNRFEEAVRLGREGLALASQRIPTRSSPAGLILEVVKTRWALRGLTEARLAALPLADNQEFIVLSRLLLVLLPAVYRIDVNLMVMHICHVLRLAMLHGVTPESAVMLSSYYAVVEINEHPRAELIRKASAHINALRAHAPDPAIDLRSRYMLLLYVQSWTMPLPEVRAELDAFVPRALALGDDEYMCYAITSAMVIALMGGENLVALQQHLERAHEQATLHHATDMQLTLVIFLRYARALRGETAAPGSFDSDDFSIAEHIERMRATGSAIALFASDYMVIWLGIFSGDLDEAARAADRGETTRRSLFGHPVIGDFLFARALMTAGRPDASHAERRRMRRDLDELAGFAEVGPATYAVRHALVLGALARGEARHGDALHAFGRAVELARQTGQVHLEALAHEYAGRCCLATGQPSNARLQFAAASHAYSRWGATAKASRLSTELPGPGHSETAMSRTLVATGTQTTGSADHLQLAMSSVLRASHALSSEIVLDRLLARLVYVVLEAAGGRACYLLLESGGELRVEAEAILEPQHTRVLHSVPLADCEALPRTLIGYVARSRRDLVLDDAAAEGAFSQDPCVVRRQLRSVLCTPIVHQGKLIGVLYLEHERTRAAFTDGKLSLLRQLAAQIAISIENAQLYRNLNVARDEAVAAARVKSRFLLNIGHELRTPLSGIVGYIELLKEDLAGDDPAQLREDLDGLYEAAQRLVRTTSNVLELTKLESGRTLARPVPIDVAALVSEVVQELRPLAQRRRDALTVALPQEPALLISDRFMLHFCLLRMLENACEFTHDGVVTLRVSCVGDRVRFEIADNGVGIDPAVLSTLFVAFTQADEAPTRRHEGAGVSLAVCKHFCDLLGGTLEATSEPDRGSTFVLDLPSRHVALGPGRSLGPAEPPAPVLLP